MEKLVLSNGAEYLLCTDGVNQYNDVATFKVRPMEGVTKTAEEVLADFTGNDTITAKIDDTAIIVTNARHYQALVRAHSSLSRFLEGMAAGLPSDLLAEDLRLCLSDLGEITGQISPEMTLKNIFSRFCIGK